MPAVAEVHVFHGASPGTPVDVTGSTTRFKRADDDATDTNDPVPVPDSGTEYSWRKNYKLRCPATGPDNNLTNLRFYSEGQSLGTDREILVDTSATYTQGSAADESAAISATNVDDYTTTTPLTVNAGQVFGPSETGDGTQDFVILQASIGPTAVAGNSAAAKGLVYRYDES